MGSLNSLNLTYQGTGHLKLCLAYSMENERGTARILNKKKNAALLPVHFLSDIQNAEIQCRNFSWETHNWELVDKENTFQS